MKTIKKVFAVLGLAVAVPMAIAPSALAANDYYSPERNGYTQGNEPESQVIINSVTNNNQGSTNAIGDERKFVRIVDTDGKLVTDKTLEAGKTYQVYVFFRNDAKNNTEATIARDVKLAIEFPAFLEKGETGNLTGTITSTNAVPAKITATAKLTAKENMALQYKVNSAGLYTSYRATTPLPVSDALFTSAGTLIGLNELDGRLAGGAENSGNVVFTLITTKADAPITTPNTGPTEVLIGIASVLAVGGGATAWFVTRRSAAKMMRQAKGRK